MEDFKGLPINRLIRHGFEDNKNETLNDNTNYNGLNLFVLGLSSEEKKGDGKTQNIY